ncbi:MAG: hypothetical protein K5931_08580 [Lachnospiraceae bacterium]|nr:hypothetical protein [Lachnospiraceae bacterium]
MRQVLVIYDDKRIPNREIRSITGNRSFGKTIFKRVSLEDRTREKLKSIRHVRAVSTMDETNDPDSFLTAGSEEPILRIFSDFLIEDLYEVSVLAEKTCYINEEYSVYCNGRVAAVLYPDTDSFLKRNDALLERYERIPGKGLVDLSELGNFRQFITSGFDARYFNALKGDKYTVVKHSSNKTKIRAEYEYYKFIPEDMKMWYAIPFDYKESEEGASYTMERFFMTDLALRYVHGSIDVSEFEMIMRKLFYFLDIRKKKEVSKEEYEETVKKLYIDKVEERIATLKNLEQYKLIEEYIRSGSNYSSIDEILNRYKALYNKIRGRVKNKRELVVGHGDLCFSNILYNRDIDLLKLIDPKGALKEEDIYTDPYYDICKLSHSICGSYDYFNSDLFEIALEDNMKLSLKVDNDNSEFIDIFKKYLSMAGIDFNYVRILETSLFLSMLPLHIDRVKKVFAFILNALRIMDTLEE